MCNWIMRNWEGDIHRIPQTGTGWKFRAKISYDKSPITKDRYQYDPDGWCRWAGLYLGDGFCFFLTKEEAELALVMWTGATAYQKDRLQLTVSEIEYEGGLGSKLEPGFIAGRGFTVGICTGFKWKHKRNRKKNNP